MASNRKKRERVSSRNRAENREEGFTPTAVKRPNGVERFDPKKGGNYNLDIIPYKVTKANVNPWAKEVGMLASERTYFAHKNIGSDSDMYVCLNKTLKKPCPICEAITAERKKPDGDEELIKSLKIKERQLWNVIDKNEPEKGVQLWDISFYLFGKQLDDRVNNASEDREYEYYADPVDGMTLVVGLEAKTYNGGPYVETTTIDFDKRGPVDKEILAKATNLDDCLIIKTYDELKAIFLQIDEDETDDDQPADEGNSEETSEPEAEKPKRTRKPKADKTESEPEAEKAPTAKELGITKGCEVTYEGGSYSVMKISKDGLKLMLVDDDDEVEKGIVTSRVQLVPEKEDEPEETSEPEAEEPVAETDNDSGDDENWDADGDDWD